MFYLNFIPLKQKNIKFSRHFVIAILAVYSRREKGISF